MRANEMRASAKGSLLSLHLVLALLLSTSTKAITLSQFQQINGFSAQCTTAYNTPITGCTASDFNPTQPCPSTCISALMNLQDRIISACAHTAVDPATLIGHFLMAKGVIALCPNEAGSFITPTVQVSTGGGYASTTVISTLAVAKGTASTTYVSITSTPAVSTPSATSSKCSSLSTSNLANSSTLIHSASASSTIPVSTTTATRLRTAVPSAITSLRTSTGINSAISTSASISTALSSVPHTLSTSSASPSAVLASSGTTSTTVEPAFIKTAVNDGSATVLTSKAEQTASNNPDAFGGGGSPFEISSCSQNRVGIWATLGVILGLIVLWH